VILESKLIDQNKNLYHMRIIIISRIRRHILGLDLDFMVYFTNINKRNCEQIWSNLRDCHLAI